MSGFVLNNHLEMKENRMLITSKSEAENSISIDSSLLKASYKPRQYVKIGEMNYIAPSGKQIKTIEDHSLVVFICLLFASSCMNSVL